MGRRLAIHVVRDHMALGALVAMLLKPALGVDGALIFWLATVLMDLDHHLVFIWRSGWRNVVRIDHMLRYVRFIFESTPDHALVALDPFHTLEVLALLYGAGILWPSVWLRALGLGCAVHFVTDVVHQIRHRRAFTRAYSLIEYLIRRRQLVAAGMAPDRPFQEAISRLPV